MICHSQSGACLVFAGETHCTVLLADVDRDKDPVQMLSSLLHDPMFLIVLEMSLVRCVTFHRDSSSNVELLVVQHDPRHALYIHRTSISMPAKTA